MLWSHIRTHSSCWEEQPGNPLVCTQGPQTPVCFWALQETEQQQYQLYLPLTCLSHQCPLHSVVNKTFLGLYLQQWGLSDPWSLPSPEEVLVTSVASAVSQQNSLSNVLFSEDLWEKRPGFTPDILHFRDIIKAGLHLWNPINALAARVRTF